MKVYLILIVILNFWVSLVPAHPAIGWDEFKLRYSKSYASEREDAMRKSIYESQVAEMLANSEIMGHKQGVNHLSDLSDDEYKKLNGLRPSKLRLEAKMQALPSWILDDSSLPDSVDWSKNPDRVGSVKNQQKCGSCWAFATTGLLEGQEFRNLTGNSVTELSEQELIDCDPVDRGCSGGNPLEAIEFIKKVEGLESEKDYPFKSQNGVDTFECYFEKRFAFETTRKLNHGQTLPEGDEATLKKVVARYGPVAVGIDASLNSLRNYHSGVYYDRACMNQLENLDHAVLLVGYGTEPEQGDYWLVKNSWSEDWGEKGYFKLARNRDNHCGVATMAIIVPPSSS